MNKGESKYETLADMIDAGITTKCHVCGTPIEPGSTVFTGTSEAPPAMRGAAYCDAECVGIHATGLSIVKKEVAS